MILIYALLCVGIVISYITGRLSIKNNNHVFSNNKTYQYIITAPRNPTYQDKHREKFNHSLFEPILIWINTVECRYFIRGSFPFSNKEISSIKNFTDWTELKEEE